MKAHALLLLRRGGEPDDHRQADPGNEVAREKWLLLMMNWVMPK